MLQKLRTTTDQQSAQLARATPATTNFSKTMDKVPSTAGKAVSGIKNFEIITKK